MSESVPNKAIDSGISADQLVCIKCGAANPKDGYRCVKCRAHLHRHCPHCHARNARGSENCAECGKPLKTSALKRLKHRLKRKRERSYGSHAADIAFVMAVVILGLVVLYLMLHYFWQFLQGQNPGQT